MNRNVIATIMIVLAIGIYATFTRAKLAEVNEVKAVNDEYILAIKNADALIKERDKVRNDYNKITAENRTRLDKMIPNTVDNIRLIIDMNSIAMNHGFPMKNIKATVSASTAKQAPSPVQQPGSDPASSRASTIPTPTLDTVTITFSVSSTYQQFIDLLKDLEANLRIMDLTHLTVTANSTGSYDYGVELKTYWLRQQ